MLEEFTDAQRIVQKEAKSRGAFLAFFGVRDVCMSAGGGKGDVA